MKNSLIKKLTGLILTVTPVLLTPGISYAENKLDWRVEGDVAGQYNSNLGQIQGFSGDFINTYTATGTLRYLSSTQTQLLARIQTQYNKFITNKDFDVLVFAGSLTLSQWFFNSLNLYVGVQPIQLVSTVNSRAPFDFVGLAGLTYFYPLGKELFFGGYQFDRLQAAAADYKSWNHTAIVGLRHPFSDNFFGNVGGRVRYRDVDISSDDIRFTGNLTAQYIVTP